MLCCIYTVVYYTRERTGNNVGRKRVGTASCASFIFVGQRSKLAASKCLAQIRVFGPAINSGRLIRFNHSVTISGLDSGNLRNDKMFIEL